MDQPAGVPRFNDDSAFKKHWPLLWLTVISALIVASFVPDFNKLGRIFDTNGGNGSLVLQTRYIFSIDRQPKTLVRPIDTGKIESKISQARIDNFDDQAERLAKSITRHGYYDIDIDDFHVAECKNYLQWLFHRRLGLYFVEHQDNEAAQNQLSRALVFGKAVGKNYPCEALSLSDLALFTQLRALEMQQAQKMLLGAALPMFSFLAALLPFALFVAFMKSRDKTEFSRRESESAGARMFLKTMLLTSWFGVIVTGWITLRNYGMGSAVTLVEPCAMSFFAAFAALVLSFVLMLRYMPPYKSLSLKRTILGCGFGGVLLALKAVVIYFGLCSSLAGHPMLKEALFCDPLRAEKASLSHAYALAARSCAEAKLKELPVMQNAIVQEMDNLLMPDKLEGDSTLEGITYSLRERLTERARADIALNHNTVVPYVWDTYLQAPIKSIYGRTGDTVGNLTVSLTIKACLAYLLLFCPEFLAYPLLALKQRQLALKAFRGALKIKEYCLGMDHWLVVSMMELFGACLLAFHKQPEFEGIGEFYLREAITRYERSRGRHDQLTIAAKMALVRLYNERGDDKQAERILLEALRDVGKDFDPLAYSDLLSEIGKTYCRQNKFSRAKQMYKQVIELLELRLSKCPASRGLLGWVHNIYATIPTSQLEVKLVNAYLDLAEVFHLAKYNGEAQRLTEDANKKIGAFEKDVIVGLEVVTAYSRARIKQAKILCEHARYDECFKLLADAERQIRRWGYQRYVVCFEIIVAKCELGLVASKAVPKFFDDARKNYLNGCLRFGNVYTVNDKTDLKERWQKLGEKLNPSTSRASNFTAGGAFVAANDAARTFNERRNGQQALDNSIDVLSGAQASWWMPLPMPASAVEPAPPEVRPLEKVSPANTAHKLEAAHSQVIKDSRATQEEGIVIRWQREHKDELTLELRPERG